MTVDDVIAMMRSHFKRWFHKRNLIIVSEHKVKHIPIGPGIQVAALSVVVAAICWASYSTGSFMAARVALKQQGQALRSATSNKIESAFSGVFQGPSSVAAANTANMGNSDSQPDVAEVDPLVNPPMATLAALDNNKLYARIALLERKVVELKSTNEAIIQRVHEKTSGQIAGLESVIRRTGLDLAELKRQVPDKAEPTEKKAKRYEGGPYVPGDIARFSSQEQQLFSKIDDLMVLNRIVSTLPLGKPLATYDEQSPFGHRIDPFNGHLAFHSGLDMAAAYGSKVRSTGDGVVVAAGWNGSYGNAVDIDHGFGIVTRYGHLSAINVREGQKVSKGTVIGEEGSTGRSTGPHVHYEVRYNDQPLNPKNFIGADNEISQIN